MTEKDGSLTLELKDRDVSVTRCACQDCTELVRRPGDGIDYSHKISSSPLSRRRNTRRLTTRAMPGMLLDLLPLRRMPLSCPSRTIATTRRTTERRRLLLLPHVDSRVVGTRRKNRSKGGMAPCDLPDGSRVTVPREGSVLSGRVMRKDRPFENDAFTACFPINNVEHADRPVRGARCESFPVVVELRIVLTRIKLESAFRRVG